MLTSSFEVPHPAHPAIPSVADFRTKFPELDSSVVDDTEVSADLGTAYQMHSANNECTLLLTAHIACLRTETLGEMDGGSGEVISDTTVGGKAQAYKPQAEDGCDVWYMRSAYGRAFKALEKRLPRHAVSFFIG